MGYFSFGAAMTFRAMALKISLAGLGGSGLLITGVHAAQAPQTQLVDPRTAPPARDLPRADNVGRADAYYYFTMGHIYEQQYEASSRAEFATQAIDAYKKAYALDTKSPEIGERLAEMYWKAQRIHDAVDEANEILKLDPNNLAPRRLLGRI